MFLPMFLLKLSSINPSAISFYTVEEEKAEKVMIFLR
jgi:hypothetical protein